MAKSVGQVHHASQVKTLDWTSLCNTKKLVNKMKQFNEIKVFVDEPFKLLYQLTALRKVLSEFTIGQIV